MVLSERTEVRQAQVRMHVRLVAGLGASSMAMRDVQPPATGLFRVRILAKPKGSGYFSAATVLPRPWHRRRGAKQTGTL